MDINTGLDGLTTLLFWASLGIRVFAFIDAVTRPAPAYEAASKLTKTAWLVILGLAVAVGVFLPGLVNLLNIGGLIAAIIYLVDVRPAVKQIGGGSAPRQGPYGPW